METNDFLSPTSFLETKEEYKAPIIEVVEVRVEKGFQASSLEGSPGDDSTY